jgi:hypothetical protein
LVLGANDGNTQTLAMNGQTFTLAGQATVNPGGQIDLSSGIFNGDTNSSGAVFSGTLTCAGGTAAGILTLTSNSVLNLYSPVSPIATLVAFTNYGTVNWSNVDLFGQNGQKIYNYGSWIATGNNILWGNGAVFNNYGMVRKTAGAGTTRIYTNTTFNTTGTVDSQSGTLSVEYGIGSGTLLARRL